ncbi:NADH dehydrogenase [ubiquinone] 1 alpha subcomplex subunit 5 isoform 6 [Homo sapiens]|nr:NADH dehydrogenase [ubiquinone] 1 alpha subcomplex subunit 5 isoform 6 [Homo sapiens]|eukprot:NP_001278233.1 NADH dehydrogenase [ubiquinone] 1 alpha subcomplex subunit 5 isoform 6 [Homo sapiens]
MGFDLVVQAGFKLLSSSNLPTLQSVGITDILPLQYRWRFSSINKRCSLFTNGNGATVHNFCPRIHGWCRWKYWHSSRGVKGLTQAVQLRLRILYTKILDVLEEIPKNAAYRKYTEQITNEKLAMVKAEPDVKKLEDQLQGGQLEEVILQAEHELNLARKMREWKLWEPLVEEPPADQWKWPI